MKFKFITGEPALLLGDALVIGDLHIGIEYELYRAGFSLPSSILKIERKILKLIRDTNTKRLILLGDVKHNIPQISWQEQKEIPLFLENLLKHVTVDIVPGNHDGNIDKISPKEVRIHPRCGFLWKDFYFNHGHTWPGKDFLKSKVLIMAHSHPAVEFVDSLGFRHVEPCWLRCKLNAKKLEKRYKEKPQVKETVIIPAFNSLISGMPINKEPVLLGPLMTNKIIELKESDVYLLDGTHLGKAKILK